MLFTEAEGQGPSVREALPSIKYFLYYCLSIVGTPWNYALLNVTFKVRAAGKAMDCPRANRKRARLRSARVQGLEFALGNRHHIYSKSGVDTWKKGTYTLVPSEFRQ